MTEVYDSEPKRQVVRSSPDLRQINENSPTYCEPTVDGRR
jgi:hypothetical protein